INFIIVIHELGHFWAARYLGVGVHEFAVGMGPVIAKRRGRRTLYTFRLFPIGGFVRVAGMDDSDEPMDASVNEGLFYNQTRWGRALILVAGSVMNLVLAFVLFSVVYGVSGKPVLQPVVAAVSSGMPADTIGMQTGDRILEVDGMAVTDVRLDIIERIQASNGQQVLLTIQRSGMVKLLSTQPVESGDGYKIGVSFGVDYEPTTPIRAVVDGARMTGSSILTTLTTIQLLIAQTVQFSDLMGPVGIVQVVGSQELGTQLVAILAMISVALGVFNLFPFPVLDGGHLLLLGIEAVRNKRLSAIWERRINQAGMAVLLVVMLMVLFQDISQWSMRADQLR
ncbi:MAG: M50 family metallopeptidase, partial [Candidatus Marinamargulisbacteria bacterium]|nr:M50 family metallopeptidase [Candidatus Marinamargulisbacteria bacterium]